MVIFIGGASHTGKTLLAQKLVERYNYPCMSIDLIKWGSYAAELPRLRPSTTRR